MDDRRFDQLAKAIAGEAGSRREAIGLAAGGVIAALFGFFGMEEEPAVARHTNRHGDRDRDRRRNRGRTRKVCHCRDATKDNCKTLKLSGKKVRRHLKRHPNDYKGKCTKNRCDDFDTECNVNRPGECCARACCADASSSAGGVCPTSGGNCCGQHHTGGYCTASFPQCCAQQACCRSSERCCANAFQPLGYCCPAGTICDANSPSGCSPAPGVTSAGAEGHGAAGAPRGRAGN